MTFLLFGLGLAIGLVFGPKAKGKLQWDWRTSPQFLLKPDDVEENRRLWESWRHLSANDHFKRAFGELYEDVMHSEVPKGDDDRATGRREVVLTILKRIRTAEKKRSDK